MTIETPHNNTIRFQRREDDDGEVWSGRSPEMLIDLHVEYDRIFQIDIIGHEVTFSPHCEGSHGDVCRCFFEDDDDQAELDCPWGAMEEVPTSCGSYHVDLDISRKITSDDIRQHIAEAVHPEFAAPASLIDAGAYTWILMDKVRGARTILDGGQVERPAVREYTEDAEYHDEG